MIRRTTRSVRVVSFDLVKNIKIVHGLWVRVMAKFEKKISPIIVHGRITWRRAESQQIAARRCSTEHNTPPGTEVVYRLFRAPTSN